MITSSYLKYNQLAIKNIFQSSVYDNIYIGDLIMKKQLNILFLLPLLLFSSCGQQGISATTTATTSHGDGLLRRTDYSLVSDPNWTQGFKLKSTSTENAIVIGNLDYNKTTTKDPFWHMAQWWAPEEYNFLNSNYTLLSENVHQYENESRKAIIDTKNGSIQMDLNSKEEYLKKYGQKERPSSQSWSHFLLEQNLDISQCFHMNLFKSLTVSFDFSINECTYLGDKESSHVDAAQFLFYLRLYNSPKESEDESVVGKKNANIWFGLPLFDNRYDFIDEYKQGDTGFVGSTGSLIYSISNREFLTEKIQYTKTYHVEIDVLSYLKDAIIYGVQNNFLPNCLWDNMVLRYFNVGWELPGSFFASSTFSNFDITYTLVNL